MTLPLSPFQPDPDEVDSFPVEEPLVPEKKPGRADAVPWEWYTEYYSTRSPALRNKIAERNSPLVTFIFQSYYNSPKYQRHREDLLQEGQIGLLQAIEQFDPHRGYKFSTYACVPLSTQILTKTGWKDYQDVQPDDETLGYNSETQQTEWTPVHGVVSYEEAPLVRFGDALWSTLCTPQHKWLIQNPKTNKVALKPLTEWEAPSENRTPKMKLVTSAPFVGGTCRLTNDEAACLGWILSDGSLYGGRQQPTGATIIQSTKKFLDEIKNLLIRLDAYSGHDVLHGEDCFALNVKASVFRRIWKKSGLGSRTIRDLVLDLKPGPRKAWFKAWYHAEGTQGRNLITQNNGEKLEALELCAFLEGHQDVHTSPKSDTCSVVTWHSRNRTSRRTKVTSVGTGPVWCPNTGLGSWTARDQFGHVFLTGNTWWIRQAITACFNNTIPNIKIPSHVRTLTNKTLKLVQEKHPDVYNAASFYHSGTLPNLISSVVEENKLNLSPKMRASVISAVNTSILFPFIQAKPNHEFFLTKEESERESRFSDLHNSTDHKRILEAFREAFDKDLSDKERTVLALRFNLTKVQPTPLLVSRSTTTIGTTEDNPLSSPPEEDT